MQQHIRVVAYYALFALVVAAAGIAAPRLNWDMIGYVAAAKSIELRDDTAVHAFAYDAVKGRVGEARFRELTAPPESMRAAEFRRTNYTDASVFAEQLAYYKGRTIYVWLIYLLSKLGVNIVTSTWLVSCLCTAVAIMLLLPLSRVLLSGASLYAVPPIAMAFGAVELARFSTADGVAFVAFVFVVLLLVRWRGAALILIPLLAAIRSDLVLFAVLALAYLFFCDRGRRRVVLASAAATIAVYVFLAWRFESPGYGAILALGLDRYHLRPVSAPPAFNPMDYVRLLVKGAQDALLDARFILFSVAAVFLAQRYVRRARRGGWINELRTPAVMLGVLAIGFVALHLVMFPRTWTRFFVGPYALGAIALVADLSRSAAPNR